MRISTASCILKFGITFKTGKENVVQTMVTKSFRIFLLETSE